MKRTLLLSLAAGLVFLLTQCSPKVADKTVRTPTTPPPAASTTPKYSADEIAQGGVIYQSSCGRCHKLFEPESRTVAQWDRILPTMYPKAKLNDAQAALVAAYVLPKAKKG